MQKLLFQVGFIVSHVITVNLWNMFVSGKIMSFAYFTISKD
jgi:hypothetical protein